MAALWYDIGRRPVEERWPRLAEAVGGEMTSGPGKAPRVRKAFGDWILTLDYVRTESGTPHTRLRAPYATSDPFHFQVRDVRLVDDLLETLGFLQDIEIGDAEIDRRFVIKGTSWAKVRGVLGDPRVREILRAQPSLHLRTNRFPPHGPPFVSTLRELHFREQGAIADVARLEGLFELFERLLPRLSPESVGYEDDVVRLIGRLLGPGHALADPMTSHLVWDGRPPRLEAATRLGTLGDPRAVDPLMGVLDDDDVELVGRAIDALARIGDPRALPPLVVMLGRRDGDAEEHGLPGRVAAALKGLGRGDLARAFERVLAGEPGALAGLGPRDELVEALKLVLGSADFGDAAAAARALGSLGAREAIPLLRAKSRGWGMKTTLTEACREALEEIESRAGLPRPAAPAGPERGTLPRPAGADGSPADTLPRSVDGEGGEP